MTGSQVRHRLGLLGILAVAIALAAWAARSYSPGSAALPELESARTALDEEELARAEENLQAALKRQPSNAEAHFLLSRVLRRRGKLTEAGEHLAKAEKLGWDRDQISEEKALAVMQRDAPLRSQEDLVAVVDEARLPRTLLLEALYRGDLLVNDWNRASFWLHLWLKQEPEAWAPRLWQAELLERSKTYDNARADYLKVLKARPDHPRALLGVAMSALHNRADYAEAEQYLRRYLEIVPGDPKALLGIAQCHYGRGELDQARALAQEVIDKHPRHKDAALLLGTIAAEQERDEEALRWLHVAEAEKAEARAVTYLLAQVYRRLGRDEEAERYHQRFTAIREARRAMEALSQRELDIAPTAEKWHAAGQICLELDEFDMASRCFKRALQLDPQHAASHAALADYYRQLPGEAAQVLAENHRRQAGVGGGVGD